MALMLVFWRSKDDKLSYLRHQQGKLEDKIRYYQSQLCVIVEQIEHLERLKEQEHD